MNTSKIILALGLAGMVMASACAPAAPAVAPTATAKPAVAPTPQPAPTATAVAKPTPKPLTKVKIGFPSAKGPTFLHTYVAQRKGFFAEEGLQPELINSASGTAARDVFLAGETDLAVFGLDSFVFVREKGVNIRYALSTDDALSWSLVVGKGSGINSVKDLKGKSIAISAPGSLTHGLARLAVEEAGLDPDKDVSYVGTGYGAAQIAAIKAKKVEAAVFGEPFLSQGLMEGDVEEIYPYGEKMKGYGSQHYAVKKEWLDKNKEVVDALRRAYSKALSFIRSNKEETFTIARQEFPDMAEPLLKRVFERLYPAFKATPDYGRENYEIEKRLVVKFGFVKDVPYPYEEVAYVGR